MDSIENPSASSGSIENIYPFHRSQPSTSQYLYGPPYQFQTPLPHNLLTHSHRYYYVPSSQHGSPASELLSTASSSDSSSSQPPFPSSMPFYSSALPAQAQFHSVEGSSTSNSWLDGSSEALCDATSSVLNVPATTARTGSKQARADSDLANVATSRTKRSRLARNTGPTVAVPGVGPSEATSTTAYGSVVRKPKELHSAHASDVWYFMRALDSPAKPDTLPESEALFFEKPRKATYIGCRLCTTDWQVWKNVNGQTDAIRTHLRKVHEKEWRSAVIVKRLKGWEKLAGDSVQKRCREREPFTVEGFHKRLTAFIVVDDQSINVVDCDEFRELILYIAGDNLDDCDLPHRTREKQMISAQYEMEFKRISSEAQSALGRVSFTSDLWTDKELRGFMAITMHFCAKDHHQRLALRARLGAFRYVRGSHTGVNLAHHFLEAIEQLGLSQKIGCITLDNASNCDTMMAELERLLHAKDIAFDREGNRIRCFPHVVNISVQTGIKALPVIDSVTATENPAYADALHADVISHTRSLVTACRQSQRRREDFDDAIVEGNAAKAFGDSTLPELQLLRDVETRWSSTSMMIDRVLLLYPAIDRFLKLPRQEEIEWRRLEQVQLDLLADIRTFLQLPHSVQEVLSYESTPTLSMVLPSYEKLILGLRLLKRKLKMIGHAIDASIRKLEEYLSRARNTRIYALSMIINPAIKLQWLNEHWSAEECRNARTHLIAAMMEYRKSMRSMSALTSSTSISRSTAPAARASSNAARSQMSGLARVDTLIRSLSAEDDVALSGEAEMIPSVNRGQPLTQAEREAMEREALEQDMHIVEAELSAYEASGVITGKALESLDLLHFWEEHENRLPILYRIALDVLPVQASAVPCERVFSSSKETDTDRRSNLDPDRLSFTNDWIPKDDELSRADVDPDKVDQLLVTGRVDELRRLFENAEPTVER